jgi:hypothetical protein
MEQTFDQPFEYLDIDPIEGTEIMQLVGLDPTDLRFPDKLAKMRDITAYLAGRIDKRYIVNKITAGRNVDRLEHIWGYLNLRKQLDSKHSELEKLQEEIRFYE